MEERACSNSPGNHALFPWHSSCPSFFFFFFGPSLSLDLWLVLALCQQEDGSAAAAHPPPLEELYSEGECRPKEGWLSSNQSPGRVLKGGVLVDVTRPVISLVETEGSSDCLGALPAPAVFWDPDLASLEDPVRECAQCHCLPGPVHPGAAPVFLIPSTWGDLGACLCPFPQRCCQDHHGDSEKGIHGQDER